METVVFPMIEPSARKAHLRFPVVRNFEDLRLVSSPFVWSAVSIFVNRCLIDPVLFLFFRDFSAVALSALEFILW